jgi:hypothetical protein
MMIALYNYFNHNIEIILISSIDFPMFDTLTLAITSLFSYILQFCLLIFTAIFPFTTQELSGVKMKDFLKNVKYASQWSNKEPNGLIMGKWFIGEIQISESQRGNDTSKLVLFILQSDFDKFNGVNRVFDEDTGEMVEQNKVQKWSPPGAYYSSTYYPIPIDIMNIEPSIEQKHAINQIMHTFNTSRSKNAVVLVHGPPGTGKSSLAYCLINHLRNVEKKTDINYIHDFNPTEPNVSIDNLYRQVKPSPKKPLIILMDEIDNIWRSVHHRTVQPHRDMRTMMMNKSGWNSFFDKISSGHEYSGIILLMTSNENLDYFRPMKEDGTRDTSYIRRGRVDLTIEMTRSTLDLI